MSVDYENLEEILDRVRRLTPEYRLLLMQGILNTLVPATSSRPGYILKYGEYKEFDGPMSNLEDYAIAEWWASDKELDGE